MSEKSIASWQPINDIEENPVGFLMEVFFAKCDPDGRPLSEDEINALGSGLTALGQTHFLEILDREIS